MRKYSKYLVQIVLSFSIAIIACLSFSVEAFASFADDHLQPPFTLTYAVRAKEEPNMSEWMTYRVTLISDGSKLIYYVEDLKTHEVTVRFCEPDRTIEIGGGVATIQPKDSIMGLIGFSFPCPGVNVLCPDSSVSSTTLISHVFNQRDLESNPSSIHELESHISAFEKVYIDKSLLKAPSVNHDFGSLNHDGLNSLTSIGSRIVGGNAQVLWTFNCNGDRATIMWEFYHHRRFQNHWIAGDMHYRFYDWVGTQKADKYFTLESATNDPIPESLLHIETYLRHPTWIEIHKTDTRVINSLTYVKTDTHTINPFTYVPGQGTLDEQIENGGPVGKDASQPCNNRH